MRTSRPSHAVTAILLPVCVITMLAAPAVAAGTGTQPGTQTLVRASRFASGAAEIAQATNLGAATAAAPVTLQMTFTPSNQAGMDQLLQQMYTKGSPLYHHFLSSAQFASQFGPSLTSVAQAEQWAQTNNLNAQMTSPFTLAVDSNVGTMSRVLGVKFNQYRRSGHAGYVATGSPLLPSTLNNGTVSGLVGLDTLGKPVAFSSTPKLQGLVKSGAPLTPVKLGAPSIATGSLTAACADATGEAATFDSTYTSAYTMDQVGDQYQLGTLVADGLNGSGVTIAVAEVNASSPTDIAAYESCLGLDNPVTVLPEDTAEGSPDPASDAEADIDIETLATLAPGASIDSYESPDTDQGLLDSVTAIVDADQAKVISISVGDCESMADPSYMSAMDTELQQAAGQGQSVFVASGDDGSEGCYAADDFSNGNVPTDNAGLATVFPASDPYVTSVGGTVLADTGSGLADLPWNDCAGAATIDCAAITGGYGASSGGVSSEYSVDPSLYSQPSVSGSSMREVPDVSSNAGSEFGVGAMEVYVSGGWTEYLGTSLSAPLWAALVADRDTGCQDSTGLFNTALYGLYNGDESSGALNAVGADSLGWSDYAGGVSALVPGNNDLTQTNSGQYPSAGDGTYDMVTGMGTPMATGLACSTVRGTYSGQVGNQVTLDGLGLEGATVTIGSQDATVVSTTATQAVVDVPAGTGTQPVEASNAILGNGTVQGSFTYLTSSGSTYGPTDTTTCLAPDTMAGAEGNNSGLPDTVACVPATETLSAGTLHFNSVDPVTFLSKQITGSAITNATSNEVNVTDATGSDVGWTVQITSTTFYDGTDALPTTASSVTGVGPATCDTGSSCTVPVTPTGYPSVIIPAGITMPTSLVMYSADADTGMGSMKFDPSYMLSIPSSAGAGTYTATWQYTLSQSPGTIGTAL